ncbi:Elongation factor-like GTPase 1 [Perkinsus olseni]|uniref:Elongation factor-like GTPase 1 n=1 Tax=Perkinsus olseni TaxID=32597 RepID=A0A7J6LK85_PEROL|nr:Elongation factor-like GTPase 1 [Perkinsus olseni]
MPVIRTSNLLEAMDTTPIQDIRNICIIAHVDHGKTTLSDYLLASNRIISPKQVEEGTRTGEAVRYLDNREDEARRMITIASSCVTLLDDEGHLFNLVDSPGHLDFSAEVSSASRLTDGCLLLVDCVEGVRPQTRHVMRQAFEDRVQPLLVLNKLDRLAALYPDPEDAFQRIRSIIEDVNMHFLNLVESDKEAKGLDEIDAQYEAMYGSFDPTNNNVLFASALHGWAFDLRTWADKLLLPKLKSSKMISPESTADDVVKFLWGDYCLKKKGFEAIEGGVTGTRTFVKLVLENIWKLYEQDVSTGREKLSSQFSLSQQIFRSCIDKLPNPVESAERRMETLAPGLWAEGGGGLSAEEVKLYQDSLTTSPRGEEASTVAFVSKFQAADLNLGCLIGDKVDAFRELNGFVAMTRVFSGEVQLGQQLYVLRDATGEGQKQAEEDESDVAEGVTVTVNGIYAVLASSLVPTKLAKAGCIVGLVLQGSDEVVDPSSPDAFEAANRSACSGVTLSSSGDMPPFVSPFEGQQSIVRVSVSPVRLEDTDTLTLGLIRLKQADPAANVARNPDTGELLIGCCGDEHLHRCIQDLRQLYAIGADCRVSEPMVELRETVAIDPPIDWRDFTADSRGDILGGRAGISWLSEYSNVLKSDGKGETSFPLSDGVACTVAATAAAMPEDLLKWLDDHSQQVRGEGARLAILQCMQVSANGDTARWKNLDSEDNFIRSIETCQIRSKLSLPSGGRPISTGSKHRVVGSNLGLDCEVHKAACNGLLIRVGDTSPVLVDNNVGTLQSCYCGGFSRRRSSRVAEEDRHHQHDTSIDSGSLSAAIRFAFEKVCMAGPLCREPVRGVVWQLSIRLKDANGEDVSSLSYLDTHTWTLSSAIVEACRGALLSPGLIRVSEPMLEVELQCEHVKAVTALLEHRRADITYSDLAEGSYTEHQIIAYMPAAEAFGFSSISHKSFADELRGAAKGKVLWRLSFSHWRVLRGGKIDDYDQCPLYELCMTRERLEDYGSNVDSTAALDIGNTARRLVIQIRRSKGLPCGEKLVVDAEKQRNLTKMK